MKVKDICSLQNGRAFKPDDWGAEGLPIIRIQNLNDEEAPFNYYAGEYNPVHEVNDGELLFSWSGTPGTSFGAFRWYRGKGVLNQHIFRVIPKTNIDKEYLKYALNGNITTIISKAHGGVGLQHITKKELDEIEITVVSEQKQKDIVAVLHRVEKVITLRKKELKELDDLIKARFVEMFGDPEINPKGWEKAPLKNHAEVIVGAPLKNHAEVIVGYPFPSEEYSEKGIDIVGGYNLMQGYIQWDDSKHWPNETGYERYLLQENDIVMAMDRPWVNGGFKIARVDATHLPALLIQRTACIRGKGLQQEFLHILLDSQRFAEHCNVTGSLVPHISNKDINSFQVILPPIKLQNDFAIFVSQVDKSKSAVQKALDEAQLLFDSLMQQYFG